MCEQGVLVAGGVDETEEEVKGQAERANAKQARDRERREDDPTHMHVSTPTATAAEETKRSKSTHSTQQERNKETNPQTPPCFISCSSFSFVLLSIVQSTVLFYTLHARAHTHLVFVVYTTTTYHLIYSTNTPTPPPPLRQRRPELPLKQARVLLRRQLHLLLSSSL